MRFCQSFFREKRLLEKQSETSAPYDTCPLWLSVPFQMTCCCWTVSLANFEQSLRTSAFSSANYLTLHIKYRRLIKKYNLVGNSRWVSSKTYIDKYLFSTEECVKCFANHKVWFVFNITKACFINYQGLYLFTWISGIPQLKGAWLIRNSGGGMGHDSSPARR